MISGTTIFQDSRKYSYPKNIKMCLENVRREMNSRDITFRDLDLSEDPIEDAVNAKIRLSPNHCDILIYVFKEGKNFQDIVDMKSNSNISKIEKGLRDAMYYLGYHLKAIYDKKEIRRIKQYDDRTEVRSLPIDLADIMSLEMMGHITVGSFIGYAKDDYNSLHIKKSSVDVISSFVSECKKSKGSKVLKSFVKPEELVEEVKTSDSVENKNVQIAETPIFITLKRVGDSYAGVVIDKNFVDNNTVIVSEDGLSNFHVIDTLSEYCKGDILISDTKGISNEFKQSLLERGCSSLFDIPKKINPKELFSLGKTQFEALSIMSELDYRGVTVEDWVFVKQQSLKIRFSDNVEDTLGRCVYSLSELDTAVLPKDFSDWVKPKMLPDFSDRDIINLYASYLKEKIKENTSSSKRKKDLFNILTETRVLNPNICVGVINFLEDHEDFVFDRELLYGDSLCKDIYKRFVDRAFDNNKLSFKRMDYVNFCTEVLKNYKNSIDLNDAALFFKRVEMRSFDVRFLAVVYTYAKEDVKFFFGKNGIEFRKFNEPSINSRIVEKCINNLDGESYLYKKDFSSLCSKGMQRLQYCFGLCLSKS